MSTVDTLDTVDTDPRAPLVVAVRTRPERSGGLRHLRRGAGALAWRNLAAAARQPQAAVFLLVQPVLFVLMFRYVFGGAISTPGGSYVDFLMPGIFTQTMVFGGIATAVALSEDMNSGFLDRIRSLPVSRAAFLTGRVLADSLRNVVSILLMTAVGVAVGFRPDLDAVRLLLAFGLLLLVGVAFLWFYAWLGLQVSTPEAAQAASFPLVFPLVFVSSVFVPTQSMPSWLQAFADHQPVSVTAQALRALLTGGEWQSPLLQAVAWSIGIGVVFAALAVRRYRRT
jgi:ABC-2 type transport system permease protein/oleandomycin transport system permease protein